MVETSGRRPVLLLMAACAITVLSLGIFIGATDGSVLSLLGVAGAVGVSFTAGRPAYRWWGWILAAVSGVVGSVRASGFEIAVYLALLLAFMLASGQLASRVAHFRSGLGLQTGSGSGRHSFDLIVERELARARRDELPISIASISLTAGRRRFVQRRALVRVAHAIVPHMRRTDAVGLSFGQRLILLLPETGRHQAIRALDRVGRILDSLGDVSVQVGTASFPEQGVTWEQLKSIAYDQEGPMRHLSESENRDSEAS